jgi:uncharacterized membrane protein YfcA
VLAELSHQVIAVVWLGAFVGGMATGGAGFAFAVVAASIWLHVLDPLHTAALVVSTGTVVQGGMIWKMRRAIEPARLWPFLVGGFLGLPFGLALLRHSDISLLKAGIGIFMVAYGLYAVLAPRLPYVSAGRAADGVIGFIGGFMGGLGGYSGIVPTMWTQLRGWPKDSARAIYQPFILAMNGSVLVAIGVVAFDAQAVALFALTLPVLFLGVLVGWSIYGRLDERRFRQVIGALLAFSGAMLVV